MRIEIEGERLFFDVHGQKLVPEGPRMVERPTAILLHGGPGMDHSHYKPQFDAFAGVAQLVYLDQRGQGRSDPTPPERCNLAQWGRDIARFCKALGIEKPVLIGSSYGGFTALSCAVQYPELASGLIIIGSTAYADRDLILARFGERGGPAAQAAAAALFTNPRDPAVFARFSEVCLPLYARGGVDPDMMARMVLNFDVLTRFFEPDSEYGRFDLRAGLKNVRVPVLMLQGRLDPIVPVECAEATARAFPDGVADLHVFDDCSHQVTLDEWPRASALITAFLEARAAELRRGAG